MSNPYITDYLNRICAIEIEAYQSVYVGQSIEAFPAVFVSSNPPYFLNRVISYTMKTQSQDWRAYRYKMGLMYVRSMLTEGVAQQAETNLYTDIAAISDYISGAIQLQSATYPAQMQWLDAEGAYLSGMTVLMGQLTSGIGAKVIGAEFILDVPITVAIDQRY